MQINIGRITALCAFAVVGGLTAHAPAEGAKPDLGSQAASASAWLLVPGKQVGSLRLKSYPKGMPLPKPDYGEGTMGHYTEMWVSKERDKAGMPLNTLVAESEANGTEGPGFTLYDVRVTSPKFHDAHGLRTGSTLASIRQVYRHLTVDEAKATILSDDKLGIGFEFSKENPSSSSKCVAIDIYSPHTFLTFDAADVGSMLDDWKTQSRK